MNVLKEYKGYQLVERYDKTYIRFWGGREEDIPCEFPISKTDAERVINEASVIVVTSPSLPRMVCRLNPATNIPITNNSPYRFGSVRAIFCLQRNFWVVRQLTSYANGLEL